MNEQEQINVHSDITKSIIQSSTGWDEGGEYGDIQFYDAILAIDTKKFKKGDKISIISISYSAGTVQLYEITGMGVIEEFFITLVPIF